MSSYMVMQLISCSLGLHVLFVSHDAVFLRSIAEYFARQVADYMSAHIWPYSGHPFHMYATVLYTLASICTVASGCIFVHSGML